jgi:hypothetical protein
MAYSDWARRPQRIRARRDHKRLCDINDDVFAERALRGFKSLPMF